MSSTVGVPQAPGAINVLAHNCRRHHHSTDAQDSPRSHRQPQILWPQVRGPSFSDLRASGEAYPWSTRMAGRGGGLGSLLRVPGAANVVTNGPAPDQKSTFHPTRTIEGR